MPSESIRELVHQFYLPEKLSCRPLKDKDSIVCPANGTLIFLSQLRAGLELPLSPEVHYAIAELGIAIGQICPITLKIIHLVFLIWKVVGLVVPSRVEILYFFALKYSQRDHCHGTVYLTPRSVGHYRLFDIPDFGSSLCSGAFVAVSVWEKDAGCVSQYHLGLEVSRTFCAAREYDGFMTRIDTP
uniref:uncharacterized protein LOC101305785 n=1 Tax=Fragaria vesca subsp. vesca TaxID=101020 RepID=UPI0005CA070E|nr:PREDICTED: uncharacterized protein LOC101305785 [Fragaria vesca subsp. vesca]